MKLPQRSYISFIFLFNLPSPSYFFFFFLNDPAPPEISPLPLHAALPISHLRPRPPRHQLPYLPRPNSYSPGARTYHHSTALPPRPTCPLSPFPFPVSRLPPSHPRTRQRKPVVVRQPAHLYHRRRHLRQRPGISLPDRVEHQRRRLLLDQTLELTAELLHRHVGGRGEARQLVRVVEVVAPQPNHVTARDGVARRRDVHPPRARPTRGRVGHFRRPGGGRTPLPQR